MNIISHTSEQVRQFLKQQALNEIYDISDFSSFYRSTYYIVAKFGLQLKAKEDELFSGDEWYDPAHRDVLIKRLEQFLNKYIK